VNVTGGAGNGSEEQTGMRTAHLAGALYPSTGSTAFVSIVQTHALVVAMPQTAPHFTQSTGFPFVTFHYSNVNHLKPGGYCTYHQV
jgi:hypothetical protein